MEEFGVLDKGFVRLVDYMGSDDMILQAARVSTGASSKGAARDRGLIRYLYRNKHSSPFEMSEFIFHIKAPLFVARQWLRHRTANVNEVSGRYTKLESEFYEPEYWRYQSKSNHQGSGGLLDEQSEQIAHAAMQRSLEAANEAYEKLLELGVAKEMARFVLPVNVYTQWFWKIDLHNLLHFLNLRMDSHAQWEIRQYATAILELVRETGAFNNTLEVFEQMRNIESGLREKMNTDKELEQLPGHISSFSFVSPSEA